MLLVVDVGNTNIHLGLWHQNRWMLTWRARTVPKKMGDEYAVLIRNFLREIDLDFRDISQVVIGSVVPRLTRTLHEVCLRYLHFEPLIVTHQTQTGVTLDVDSPEQVGPDRIVNAAAIKHKLPDTPAIVVDFGTATTFDVISREGAYLGGAISPGINLAAEALFSQTARLYSVDLTPPPNSIGRNTSHALQSGIFLGYLSLIEGMIGRIKRDLPNANPEEVAVIATGGLAVLFNQHCAAIDRVEDLLTLDGLRIIADLNRV